MKHDKRVTPVCKDANNFARAWDARSMKDADVHSGTILGRKQEIVFDRYRAHHMQIKIGNKIIRVPEFGK